ncbi:DUF2905 domain-containing protein [Paraburkholderia azotifigens]|uniref:DUF2905 domain-containing protein n=1 Tax=Paraburkholderia azotifigens TaxID=2057004 RepID=UPI00316C8EB8
MQLDGTQPERDRPINVASLGWRWLSRLPLGRFPGDIDIVRPGFSFHFQIVTCIVISVVLSIPIRLFRQGVRDARSKENGRSPAN